jgi:hypothetical protein
MTTTYSKITNFNSLNFPPISAKRIDRYKMHRPHGHAKHKKNIFQGK